uniref:C2H2-type domain-containing protein n=1 Tax=Glossina palpalis gambiensis TaxID=67801 RepID=A0A1B0BXD7_9MUSC
MCQLNEMQMKIEPEKLEAPHNLIELMEMSVKRESESNETSNAKPTSFLVISCCFLEAKTVSCELCNFQTPRKTEVIYHLKATHKLEAITAYFKRIFCCAKYPKRYSNKNDLHRHAKRAHFEGETKKPPFICSSCGISYFGEHRLVKHSHLHTYDMPFKCSFCKKVFRRVDTLKCRLIEHSDGNLHTCPSVVNYLKGRTIYAYIYVFILGFVLTSAVNARMHLSICPDSKNIYKPMLMLSITDM